MNNKSLNCPNCGERLECTKVDYLFGKDEFKCNNCHKQYKGKYNYFYQALFLFLDLKIAQLISGYLLDKFSITNYAWLISFVIELIIIVALMKIEDQIKFIRKMIDLNLIEQK